MAFLVFGPYSYLNQGIIPMKIFRLLAPGSFLLILILTLSALTAPQKVKKGLQIDSLKADRAKHINAIRKSIKGKENFPADSVFENIEIFKGAPAGRLLAIMDIAYSQSLGVSCGHCHNTNNFASEEKPEKQIAREMWAFAAQTRDLLKNVKGLKSENPTVNCTTCHRGQIKPALNLN